MTIQEYEEQFGIVAPTFRLPRHKATEEEKMHYAIMSDYSRKKLVQTARKM